MGALRGRRLGLALHWLTAVLVVAVAVASDPGTQRVLGGLLALVGGAFVLRAVLVGALSPVTPRMRGWARAAHLGLHRGLLVALAGLIATGLPIGMAGPGVAEMVGPGDPWLALWHSRFFALTFALAAGHLVFNIWRGAALGERPFAAMLPKV
ncbi:MAG: hypothetical protein AAGC57_11995 [Pseudomonadota bacterium]